MGHRLRALATATRPIAPALVLGLLVRHLEMRRAAVTRFACATACRSEPRRTRRVLRPLVKFGDPIGFVTTQAGWQHSSPPRRFSSTARGEMKRIDLIFPPSTRCWRRGARVSVAVRKSSAGATRVHGGRGRTSADHSRDFIGLGPPT